MDLDEIAAGSSVLGFKIFGEADHDTAARSVSAAGDVNGDGLADLIIGAVWNDSDGSSNNGAAYVIFGQANCLF